MADSAEGAGFWLPSEFFDDFQVGRENLDKNSITESDPEFCFPTEFPYDSGAKSDGLLEFSPKRWLISTSPQPHISSWTGRSAGHVAGPTKPKVVMAPPRSLPDPSVAANICMKQREQGRRMWQQMYRIRMIQGACPVQQSPTRIFGSGGRASVLGGGAAVKRWCAGTGVFLPRRYENHNYCNGYSLDPRNRPGFAAPLIPNRNAIHANFENLNGFYQPQQLYQSKLGRGVLPEHGALSKIPEHDLLMARRNALLLQHQRSTLLDGSSPMNCSGYLPLEWTY